MKTKKKSTRTIIDEIDLRPATYIIIGVLIAHIAYGKMEHAAMTFLLIGLIIIGSGFLFDTFERGLR